MKHLQKIEKSIMLPVACLCAAFSRKSVACCARPPCLKVQAVADLIHERI